MSLRPLVIQSLPEVTKVSKSRQRQEEVNFVQVCGHLMPVSVRDRQLCVQHGVLATRFPLAAFDVMRSLLLRKLNVKVHQAEDVVSDLLSHFDSQLPEGCESRVKITKIKNTTVLLVWKDEDAPDDRFQTCLKTLVRYLARYCLSATVDSQPKSGGHLYKVTINVDETIVNSSFFGVEAEQRSSTALELSPYVRLSFSFEERGEDSQRAVYMVVALQDRANLQTEWRTTLTRCFPAKNLSRSSVTDVIDFFYSFLASS